MSDEPAHRTTVFPGRQSLTDCKCVCIVCLNDLERAYWMGTEICQLGGYGFQGVTLGVDGSCKDGKMGAGCHKFREQGEGKCARVGREEEGMNSNRPGWEGWY